MNIKINIVTEPYPAAITRKVYDALPAWCDCIRSRVGPEHNIMFVIYSLGVTLAGNSQAMRRETSLPHNARSACGTRVLRVRALVCVGIIHREDCMCANEYGKYGWWHVLASYSARAA